MTRILEPKVFTNKINAQRQEGKIEQLQLFKIDIKMD